MVLHHFPGPFADYPFLKHILDNGSTGVTFFFVLSGFILAYNYRAASIPVRSFLRARFARVYPVYLLGVLMAFPFLLSLWRWGAPEWPLSRVVTLAMECGFLVQAWHPASSAFLNPPGWSLSAEAFFYLSFPFVASWGWFRARTSRPWLTILALWTAGLALTWGATRIGALMSDWTEIERARFAGFSPWVRIPEFILGAFLGWCHGEGRLRVPRPALVASVLVAVLGGILVVPSLVASNPYFHNGALSLLYGTIILALAQDRGRLRDLMSNRSLLFLGEASYALYILHYPVWAWMEWLSGKFGMQDAFRSPAGLLPYLVVAIAVAAAAYRWLEIPARRWMRGRA